MAIQVEHGPSMITYGQAVASAAQNSAATQRAAQYADYLKSLQQMRQDYELKSRELAQQQEAQRGGLTLDAQKLNFAIQQAQSNAQANWWQLGILGLGENVNAMRNHLGAYM